MLVSIQSNLVLKVLYLPESKQTLNFPAHLRCTQIVLFLNPNECPSWQSCAGICSVMKPHLRGLTKGNPGSLFVYKS